MEQATAGDDSRQGNKKEECKTDPKQTDECGGNLETTNDSASSTGGSSNKSSKPLSGDFLGLPPTDERKTRKRRNDVLYSRNRRQRERNEADTLREHSAMLTRTNEALKKEETRLLHLYVDATKTIEELNHRDEGQTSSPPSDGAKMAAYGTSSSDIDSTAIALESESSTDHNLHHKPPAVRDRSQTAANDASSELASILPLLLLNASSASTSNHSSLSQTLSHVAGSMHPWIVQQMLQGISATHTRSTPHPYADTSAHLMSTLSRRNVNQNDPLFAGGALGQTSQQVNAIDATLTNSLSHLLWPAHNPTVPGEGATLPPAPPPPSGVPSQNTSVEAALLESLVCSMLSGNPTADLGSQPTNAVQSIPSSSTPAIALPGGGANEAQGAANLRLLLETLIAARNSNTS